MVIAVYPGTFDPVHYGHLDIAIRAAAIFDNLIVAVYDRPSKNPLFSVEERLAMMQEALQGRSDINVESYSGLTVDYVRRKGGRVIVRGLRIAYDFELEYQMALTNKKLAPEIESICLMTSLEYAFLSSSTVKEVAMVGGCVEKMVPPHVKVALERKFRKLEKDREDKVKLISLRD